MTRPFDISNPDDTLTLDASGRGKTIFTVTNILQKPMRGTLRVRGTDAAKEAWFSVAGNTEREFLPGTADQVEIDAKVPSGTPQAKYSLRLDALSVSNPEEDLTEGPTITVKIPEVKKEPEKKLPAWVWIVIAVVLLIVIGLVTYLGLRPKPAPPPPPAPAPAPAPAPTPAPAMLEFNDPRIQVAEGMLPLDVCREWAKDCGKPAADAFCASKNAGFAAKFNVAQNSPPTVVISTKQICRDATCDRITWVQCTSFVLPGIRFHTQVLRGKSIEMPE